MKKITPKVEHGRVNDLKGTFFAYNGWPSVCKDDRGILYAVASSMRMQHVDPTGKNCMYLSFNEGKTWTRPIVVTDTYYDDRDMGIAYLGDGKMIISWFSEGDPACGESSLNNPWIHPADKEIIRGFTTAWTHLPEETFKAQIGSFVKTSDDYGVTWSDPIYVPLTAPHGPCVCKDGTLVYMGKEMDPEYLAPNPIVVYSSHDGGKTWEKTGVIEPGEDNDITNENMHEPHIVELPGGRLLGAIRIHARNNDGSDLTVYTTYSDDKGKTWSKPVCIGCDGAPPHLLVHSSGAVICSYSCRRKDQWCERACVSHDNGETWTEDYALDDRVIGYPDMGYPASVELSDGSILTVYYQKWPGEGYTSILTTKWNLEDNN